MLLPVLLLLLLLLLSEVLRPCPCRVMALWRVFVPRGMRFGAPRTHTGVRAHRQECA